MRWLGFNGKASRRPNVQVQSPAWAAATTLLIQLVFVKKQSNGLQGDLSFSRIAIPGGTNRKRLELECDSEGRQDRQECSLRSKGLN